MITLKFSNHLKNLFFSQIWLLHLFRFNFSTGILKYFSFLEIILHFSEFFFNFIWTFWILQMFHYFLNLNNIDFFFYVSMKYVRTSGKKILKLWIFKINYYYGFLDNTIFFLKILFWMINYKSKLYYFFSTWVYSILSRLPVQWITKINIVLGYEKIIFSKPYRQKFYNK